MKRFLSLFLIAFPSFSNAQQLDENTAIRLAERFVAENGYTSAPPDTAKLRFELLDFVTDKYPLDSLLKKRRGTLQSRAFCVYQDGNTWNIGFLSNRIELDKLDKDACNSDLQGRAVTVSSSDKIAMAHRTPRFSVFRKIKPCE